MDASAHAEAQRPGTEPSATAVQPTTTINTGCQYVVFDDDNHDEHINEEDYEQEYWGSWYQWKYGRPLLHDPNGDHRGPNAHQRPDEDADDFEDHPEFSLKQYAGEYRIAVKGLKLKKWRIAT